MDVWLVVDSQTESGAVAVKGIFDSEQQAKLFLADYVLENAVNIDASFLELVQRKVEVKTNADSGRG